MRASLYKTGEFSKAACRENGPNGPALWRDQLDFPVAGFHSSLALQLLELPYKPAVGSHLPPFKMFSAPSNLQNVVVKLYGDALQHVTSAVQYTWQCTDFPNTGR